jgi:cystathionine gamma-synthase
MQKSPRSLGPSTLAVHGGDTRPRAHFSVTPPVVFSSTYTFARTQDRIDQAERKIERGVDYGRYGNPTQSATEAKLAALEDGQSALLFASGMAAVTSTMLAVLPRGGHVVLTNDCYRKTRQFAETALPRLGFTCDLVPPDVHSIEAALRPETRLIFTESPTNPYLNVVDLRRLAELARRRHIKTAIDSTFATPYNQNPLELGIDIVVHSATKYLGGHNDLLSGCVIGAEDDVTEIRELRGMTGPIPDPMSSFLLGRGLKTLALRMQRHNANGQALAEYLERHPKVERVHYPGLSSHPSHDLARRQMRGFGGVVSFELRAGLEACTRVVDAVAIPQIAPSLGGVESLIEQPRYMSFNELTNEQRQAIGIKDNLVRLSCGIEDADDLIADLDQALARI